MVFRRQKAVARAETLHAKWGRMAAFFTSTRDSRHCEMKNCQLVV